MLLRIYTHIIKDTSTSMTPPMVPITPAETPTTIDSALGNRFACAHSKKLPEMSSSLACKNAAKSGFCSMLFCIQVEILAVASGNPLTKLTMLLINSGITSIINPLKINKSKNTDTIVAKNLEKV